MIKKIQVLGMSEYLTCVIYDILKEELPDHLKLEVTLYETPRNFVKYPVL